MKSSRLLALAVSYLRRPARAVDERRGASDVPAIIPSMALERWGTVVSVAPSSLGARFTLGCLTFRFDDGRERVLFMERARTTLSFHWLNEQGKWQRRAALVSEIRPGMRAEVWASSGFAESVLLEGRPEGPRT
jgi:hypothetical protein